ncbi:MAG: BON domain-containing protein [Bacteroidetes bacterium]|nr:MAG: BON domain-containing protein [Bacteroidota bacterium]
MGIFDLGADASSIEEALADLDISGLSVSVDGGEVTISGEAASERVREKALAMVGEMDGVEEVIDDMSVTEDDEDDDEEGGGDDEGGRTHTVVYGDTLWGLSEKYYKDGSRYMEIFNANKALWKNYKNDPNVIHVGWELHIP